MKSEIGQFSVSLLNMHVSEWEVGSVLHAWLELSMLSQVGVLQTAANLLCTVFVIPTVNSKLSIIILDTYY